MSEAKQCIDCGRGAEPRREHCPRCGGELEFVDVLEYVARFKQLVQERARKTLEEVVAEGEKILYSDSGIDEIEASIRTTLETLS